MATVAAGCNEILGNREHPVEDASLPADATSPQDGMVDAPDARDGEASERLDDGQVVDGSIALNHEGGLDAALNGMTVNGSLDGSTAEFDACASDPIACPCPTGMLNCAGVCQPPTTSNACGVSCASQCPGPTSGTGIATCLGSSCSILCATPTTSLCGTACVDESSDPENCGRCGHSCQGGGCATGTCQAITISPLGSSNWPVAITVDSNFVYWLEEQGAGGLSNSGSVRRAPIDGGGTVTVLASNQTSPGGAMPAPLGSIAVNSTGVFWITSSGLNFLPNGSTTPTAVATNFSQPAGPLVLTATAVYWLDETSGAFTGHMESILSLPLSPASGLNASAVPSSVIPTSPAATIDCAVAMTASGAMLFWLQTGCFASSGLIQGSTVPPTANASDLLQSGVHLNGPYTNNQALLTAEARIAADSDNVYFGSTSTASSTQELDAVPTTGGPVTTLSSTAKPNGIAVDSNNIYWTDVSSIMTMPRGGGPATSVVTGQSLPYDIVVDAHSVYWTNYSSPGSVMKVAKP